MGFREVSVVEIREVLRGWLAGAGLRTVAERAGVDRKTARRYVQAAQAAGLDREAGFGAVDDVLVAAVVEAVRPARPNGHGTGWEALLAREDQIRAWLTGKGAGKDERPLTVVKVHELLARQGCVVPYRTVHRFAAERCGYRAKGTTVRVADGEPGAELARFRVPGVLDGPGVGTASQGSRADPDGGVLASHVRVVDVLPDPGRGHRRV